MKGFGASGYLLSNARLEVRLVYSGFLLLVGIGLVTTFVLQWGHVGPTPTDIATYYRGGERAGAMSFPKTVRELVELTHFHAFIMGTVYLVLAHLLVATRAGEGVKRVAIILGLVGLLGDLAGVWLTRFVAAGFAWLLLGSWIAQWIGFAAYLYYPLREMWFSNGHDGEDEPFGG